MCGVVALFSHRDDAPPPAAEAVADARDLMSHRGPDGAGLWSSADGRVVLGHRRLAILDPTPLGAQPMTDDEAGLALSFNGEIYNFRELRAELAACGGRFRTGTDTEVVLQLYRHWGIEGLSRLRGMFAFALWDRRRRGLLLARDGLGIKPLYVFDIGGRVGAASELRALRALLPEPERSAPDLAGHLGFFIYGWVPEPFTPVAAIRMLPAGSWRWIDGRGSREGRFFDLVSVVVGAEENARPVPRAEGLAALGAAVRESVGRHLIADVPVSLFLSAGVDSAALAAFAVAAGGPPPAAVTLGADPAAEGDEVPQAAAAAAGLGLAHHFRRLGRQDFAGQRDRLLAAMDVPSIDGVNSWFVSETAAACGFKVALSGIGGDELMGGYSSFHQIPRLVAALGPLARLPGLGRAIRWLAAPVCSRLTSPKYASLVELAAGYPEAYRLRRSLFLPWELDADASPGEITEALTLLDAATGFDGRYQVIRSPRLRVFALEAELYLRGHLLRDADWAGMAHSLEIRPPLADATLIGAVVPLIAGMTPPPSKADLGDVAGGFAALAARRRKTGFVLPVRDWLAGAGGPRVRGLRGWAAVVYGDWCRRHGLAPLVRGPV